MNHPDIENLARRAALAAERAADQEAAFADMDVAESDLLRRVLEAVTPAVRAIGTRQREARDDAGDVRLTAERIVWLAGVKPGPATDGHGAFLFADGSVRLGVYTSTRTTWSTTWLTTSVEEVARQYAVQPIIGLLSELIDADLAGNRDRRIQQAAATARQLRAICMLLEP